VQAAIDSLPSGSRWVRGMLMTAVHIPATKVREAAALAGCAA
jgi:hypothetical protein